MKNILIDEIVEIEWGMFSATENVGGKASCQQDRDTFEVMRRSQFENWDEDSVSHYLGDIKMAVEKGENLLAMKYAYMMRSADPEGYRRIAHLLPEISGEKRELVESLVARTVGWCEDFARRWPGVASAGRSIRSATDSLYNTSVATYSRGEFSTYGVDTLRCLARHYEKLWAEGVNLHEKVVEREIAARGIPSLADAERMLCR